MSARPRILVLDADMVPSLTIARSLARRRCSVDIAGHTHKPLSARSHSVTTVFRYPDPLTATQEFVQWLESHTRQEPYDLVIPVTERTLVPLSRNREQFAHTKLAMPALDSLEVALDKAQTLELARRIGVPVPGGVSVSTLEELDSLEEGLQYPVVLKPARSIGAGDDGPSQLQVSYAFDAVGLRAGCTHALKFGAVLLQEFFHGEGVGVELIARNGEVLYAFQHLRLHEVPLTGGGSSLRKSEPVVPALLDASKKLIAELQWNGVAMVEFKWDPASGEFCLMEINGRFWGSLPLAVAAGADFPAMLLDLELDGDIGSPAPYRNDIYCRLLSRDMHWYEAVLRGEGDRRIAKIPSRKEVLTGLGLFLSPGHRYDVQGIRDPLPGLVDIGVIFSGYVQRFTSLAREKFFLAAQKRCWGKGHVTRAVADADSMLFLCYGNINRSALADVLIRAYAEDSGIAVASAGFHQETERPADPVMQEIAAEAGVDLSGSRSACVTQEQLRDSDVIFVMEKTHYDRLADSGVEVAGRVFLLGAQSGANDWPAEIEDPYGRSRESYTLCYERIDEAVETLKAMIAERGSD